ncbi:MAG: metallophosphoesterase family protein [Hyphomicrobiales bacterium]
MPFLGEAALPEGLRVYAIGDVHGCLDRLKQLHDAIDADTALWPAGEHRLIHCGDYVDRGPDVSGVVSYLIGLAARRDNVEFLKGNHEQHVLGFLSDPGRVADVWLTYGGADTLASYGVSRGTLDTTVHGLAELRDAFEAALPVDHLAFLRDLPTSARFGDFLFVHAGIRPGVPLDRQEDRDLMWIRRQFLDDERDHGVVVVHGHTPVDEPEVRPNRINIDTGAVYGGDLTCLVIEGTDIRFLKA